jgi:hypothetical protein
MGLLLGWAALARASPARGGARTSRTPGALRTPGPAWRLHRRRISASLLDARIYVEVDAGEASFGDTHAARC